MAALTAAIAESAPAGEGINLAPNPDGATGTTAGWSAAQFYNSTTAVLTNVADARFAAGRAFRLTGGSSATQIAPGPDVRANTSTPYMEVVPGDTVYAAATVIPVSLFIGGVVDIAIEWYNALGVYMAGQYGGTNFTSRIGEPYRIAQRAVIPAGAAFAHMYVRLRNAGDLTNGQTGEVLFSNAVLARDRVRQSPQKVSVAATNRYSSLVLAEASLLSYWRLNETSGTTAVDSKSAKNLTINGAPSLGQPGLLPGDPSTSIVQTLNTQYLSRGFDVAYSLTAFTFECLVRIDGPSTAAGSTTAYIARQALIGTAGRGWFIQVSFDAQGKPNISAVVGYGTPNVTVAIGVVAAVRHMYHVALVINGTAVALYLDGKLATSTTLPSAFAPVISADGQSLTMGGLAANNANLVGALDELAFYTSALSAATIAAHYAAVGDLAQAVDNPTRSTQPKRTRPDGAYGSDEPVQRIPNPAPAATPAFLPSNCAVTNVTDATSPTGLALVVSNPTTNDAFAQVVTSTASYTLGMAPGRTYTLGAWVKVNTAARGTGRYSGVTLWKLAEPGGPSNYSYTQATGAAGSTDDLPVDTWVRRSVTRSWLDTDLSAFLRLYLSKINSGPVPDPAAEARFAGITLYEGAVDLGYPPPPANVTRTLAAGRTAAESAPAVDTPTRSVIAARGALEVAAAIDAAARRITATRATADLAPAADVTTGSLTAARAVADLAPAIDVPSRSVAPTRSVAEIASAMDNPTRSVTARRVSAEDAPAVDDASRALVLARSLTDAAPAAEMIVAVRRAWVRGPAAHITPRGPGAHVTRTSAARIIRTPPAHRRRN